MEETNVGVLLVDVGSKKHIPGGVCGDAAELNDAKVLQEEQVKALKNLPNFMTYTPTVPFTEWVVVGRETLYSKRNAARGWAWVMCWCPVMSMCFGIVAFSVRAE